MATDRREIPTALLIAAHILNMSNKPSATKTTPGKKAFVPRPTRPAEERLPKLYRGLTDQLDEGHFANAIKTCRKSAFLASFSGWRLICSPQPGCEVGDGLPDIAVLAAPDG